MHYLEENPKYQYYFKVKIILVNQLEKKNEEIKDLKSKFQNYELLEKEKLITISFITQSENIIWSVICKKSNPFKKLENLFYKDYPEYKEKHLYFKLNRRTINKEENLEKNNIENNDVINIIIK